MVNPRAETNVRAFLQPTVLGRLGPDLLNVLAERARVERYEVSTLLNTAGTPLQWLRYVVSGHIEIVARSASGKEVSISDVGPGAWATWLPCFVPMPLDHDLVAAPDSCFIAIPVVDVRKSCEMHPEIYPWIMQDIGMRMRLLMEWAGQSVLVKPEQRMAKLIHILARDQRLSDAGGTLNVTQSRLAGLARCSRQSANALLGALEKRGLIQLAYGKCEIADISKLAAFADMEDFD